MPAVSPPIAVPAPHTEFSGSQPPGPACSEALWMLDPSGRVVHWSAAAEQLTGYAAAQIVGEPFTRLTRQDEPAAAQRLLDAAKGPRELWTVDGGGHIDALTHTEWRERLLAYLDAL